VQDCLLAYTWVGPSFKNISHGRMLGIAVQAALINMPYKLMLSYFVLYVSIPKISAGKQRLGKVVTEIALVFILSVLLYRYSSHYILYAHIYGGVINEGHTLDIANVLVAVIDIGFIAGLAASIKFVRIQVAGKEREKSLMKEKLGAELKFLRNQTNPHFLLNTLNNIYFIAQRESPRTADLLEKLSSIMRYFLDQGPQSRILLSTELDFIRNYVELEKMRIRYPVNITFRLAGETENTMIPPMLLIPLVENVFKHGIDKTKEDNYIDIYLQVAERLHFEVINNTGDQPFSNGKGTGLKNLSDRLTILYGGGFKLETSRTGAVYTSRLNIPL